MDFGRGARALLLLAALVIIVSGLRLAAAVLVPMLLALFIAMVASPLVVALVARRVPRSVAVLCAVVLVVGVVTGFGALASISIDEFNQAMPRYQARLGELSDQGMLWLVARGFHIPQDAFRDLVDPAQIMQHVGTAITSIAAVLSDLVLVLLIFIFMLAEGAVFVDKLRSLAARDPDASGVLTLANTAYEVQKYLAVKTASSVVTGALVAAWVYWNRVDFPLLLALLAFALNYVPTLGSVISLIPAVVLALVQYGFHSALIVAAGYVTINVVLGNFVEPRIIGRAVGLSPLIVVLSMFVWGWLWGPVGAVLSVPLTMIVKIILSNTKDLAWIAEFLGPSNARTVA